LQRHDNEKLHLLSSSPLDISDQSIIQRDVCAWDAWMVSAACLQTKRQFVVIRASRSFLAPDATKSREITIVGFQKIPEHEYDVNAVLNDDYTADNFDNETEYEFAEAETEEEDEAFNPVKLFIRESKNRAMAAISKLMAQPGSVRHYDGKLVVAELSRLELPPSMAPHFSLRHGVTSDHFPLAVDFCHRLFVLLKADLAGKSFFLTQSRYTR
jgi:hypothetical protein